MVGPDGPAPAPRAEIGFGFVIGQAGTRTSAAGTEVTVPVLAGGRQRLLVTAALPAPN